MNKLYADCECCIWARTHGSFITKHHPQCPLYAPLDDAAEMIDALLDGVDAWAADEDGIHPEAWNAYQRACYAIGRKVSQEVV